MDDSTTAFAVGRGMEGITDDEPIDEFKHDKMLEAIRSIGGQKRLMVSHRTEYAPVSEFSLGSKVNVQLDDLLGSLGKTTTLSKVRVKANQASAKGIRTIPLPLEKPEANKIGRVVTYENVCKEVSKWDRVVFQNRAAEQVVYPLHQPDMRMETSREVVKRFKMMTPLEREVAALLESRRPVVPDPSPDERKKLKTRFALEEALEMRREMQITRARQSYREAKARYQKKIKSKRYHRILKKERAKKEVKDFEALQKVNPELAQEKLDQIERQRITERMTLRHRNTGRWAREQIIKFKNDKESGKAIREQIELSRHLTAKQHVPSDSEDDAEDREEDDELVCLNLQLNRSDSSNPWMNSGTRNTLEIGCNEEDNRKELLVGYRKFWEEDNRLKEISNGKKEPKRKPETSNKELTETSNKEVTDVKTKKCKVKKKKLPEVEKKKFLEVKKKKLPVVKKKKAKKEADEEDVQECEVDRIFKEAGLKKKNETKQSKTSMKRKKTEVPETMDVGDTSKTSKIINETLVRKRNWDDFENPPNDEDTEPEVVSVQKKMKTQTQRVDQDVAIDPQNYITVKERFIKFQIPDGEGCYDDDAMDDDEEERRITIAEAFADDDVIDEFKAEKQKAIDGNRLKDVDLTLPGWGEWGGKGLDVSKKKRNRFTVKAPNGPPRKDRELGHVILNEKSENSIRSLQVGTVPFAFRNADEFQRNLAAPIGKHWNPETAFRRLIAPRIVTKIGAIIEPIDADFLDKKKLRAEVTNGVTRK